MAEENDKDIVDETVEDTADSVVDKGKEIAEDAVDAVKDAAGAVADKAGDAVDAVGGVIGKGADVAGDAAGAAKDVAGAAVDKAGDAAEAVGDAAGAAVDKGKEVAGAAFDKAGDAAGAAKDAAGAAADKVSDAFGSVTDAFDGDGDGGSVLSWLLPLLLLGLVLVLGFMYCSKPADNAGTNTNQANEASNSNEATGEATESSVNIEAKDGKYTITGTVISEEVKSNVQKEAEAVWGAGNVDVSGLKVDANAKPFKDGWWEGFKGLLPDLKDWKNGSIGWAEGAIKTVGEIPGAIGDKIKSLFGGWGLPVSIAGVEDAAKAANEKAMELLAGADSVDEVVAGLNASIINFASGSSDVPADAKPILEKAATVLKAQKEGTTIEIGGHTDNVGNADSNMQLSKSRAESVMKALVDLGVPAAMLSAKGYGSTVEKASNDTEEGKFANRRIEYKVGGSGDQKPADDAAKTAESDAKPAN